MHVVERDRTVSTTRTIVIHLTTLTSYLHGSHGGVVTEENSWVG